MSEDKYIKLLRELRYRLEKNQPTNEHEFHKLINSLEIDHSLSDELKEMLFSKKEIEYDFDKRYFMTLEAYFKLLQYEELSEAREESMQARREAKKATRIAILAIIIGVITGILEILSNFL